MSDFYAILKIQNGRIRKAMEDAGIPNAARLAERAGKSPDQVGRLLNFKISPRCLDGTWRKVTIAICEAMGIFPEDIFPDHLCKQVSSNQLAAYVERGQIPFAAQRHLPGPVEAAINGEMKQRLEKVLHTLNFREREILKLRYGLDKNAATLDETAVIYGVSPERVRQIEAKAIRKLQHPERARRLEGYL